MSEHKSHDFLGNIVRVFLHSNLPIILILLSVALGAAAMAVTPREEDPQIVVPLADVYVSFPGHSAGEVEQLVATPLESILSNIDGVEYVYSMSRENQAIITVRFYVGQDRERSLVKVIKKIDENVDRVPPGAAWVVKPVEIDDVPIVTLALRSGHSSPYVLRRVAEELVQRLSAVSDLSRAYVVGGQSRLAYVYLDHDQLAAYNLSPLEVQRAIAAANVSVTAGDFSRMDVLMRAEGGRALASAQELRDLVVGVAGQSPVFLKDVARVQDGPAEEDTYTRHGWGPARQWAQHHGQAGAVVGQAADFGVATQPAEDVSQTAVTIAVAKKKGANAVSVADEVVAAAESLKAQIVPDDVEMVVTRNAGLTSNDKVNELIEALAVALVLAVAVLTLGLGWRESLIVAMAVPVVFGLTLAVNLLAGLTINRVTLFALILSLGLLADDPIVDVENIARHFRLRRKASLPIVLEAVSEIRPPLIAATLAVIVSFLPMFFITGMMGPYMRPMALNVPVTMIMSMVVAFTITPWLTYHVLKKRYNRPLAAADAHASHDPHDADAVKRSLLFRAFSPIMSPLLRHTWAAWGLLAVVGLLMAGAVALAAMRQVPLKMLPYGNKNELSISLDMPSGSTLQRTDALVRDIERYLAAQPEVTDFTSYVGLAAPMDFNGLVRHYYLRRGENVADIQLNVVDRGNRSLQTHGLALRMRDELTAIARSQGAQLKLIEAPPGPPVLSTVVVEVYGHSGTTYDELVEVTKVVRRRLGREPGVVDVDTMIDQPRPKRVFVVDKEKASLAGISTDDVASTLQLALGGRQGGILHVPDERNPLRIELRLPRDVRSSPANLSQLRLKGSAGQLVPLAELGRWDEFDADGRPLRVDQTIYHKNLRPVMYVTAETAGRPPADVVVDVMADLRSGGAAPATGAATRPVNERSFFANGGGIAWSLPAGTRADFAGEGEWRLTLDVFRDMGLAFIAAMALIYIILVAQTRSFVIPLVVMMAIPLTIIGIMPGFWLLNKLTGGFVGGYANPVFFTATAMIGMIALAGIVTRSSIIIVDFIHLSLARGRSLADAIIESCVVRLRPILLTAAVAMLSALPIATDPIFSGLAWALIFGLLASTLFTMLVIPVIYWLLYRNKPGHGAALPAEPQAQGAPGSS